MKLAQELVSYCQKHHMRFAFAESCTGGALSAAITQIPGASDCFMGAYITYSNSMKEHLGVNAKTLEHHGAVSAETVIEMAKATMSRLNVDFTVAISGIAGPSGGSKDKPVGTVFIAVTTKNHTHVEHLHLQGNRQEIITQSCEQALTLSLSQLKDSGA